jgi:spore germination protein GerM
MRKQRLRLSLTCCSLAAFFLVASLATVGCGDSSRAAESAGSVTIYLISKDGTTAVPVSRQVPDPTAETAMTQLLEGPTPEEEQEGLRSALSDSVALKSFEIRDHVAEIDLSGLPDPAKADILQLTRIISQIVRTTHGLSDVESVRLASGGSAWGLFSMQGEIQGGPYDLATLRSWDKVCTAEPGSEATPDHCFDPDA